LQIRSSKKEQFWQRAKSDEPVRIRKTLLLRMFVKPIQQ